LRWYHLTVCGQNLRTKSKARATRPWFQIAATVLQSVYATYPNFAPSVFGFPQSDFALQRAASGQGKPTNFTIQFGNSIRTPAGSLFDIYSWSSSTGKLKDLSSCTFEIIVTYPSQGTHVDPQSGQSYYTWPKPMLSQSLNPEVFYTEMNHKSFKDLSGYAPTDGFDVPPYKSTTFDADVIFNWSCPYVEDGEAQTALQRLTITRDVFLNTDNGKWTYQISKPKRNEIWTIVLPDQ